MSDHSMRQLLTALMLVSIVVGLIGAVIGSVIAVGLSECSSAPRGLGLGSTSLAVFFLILLLRLFIFSANFPIAFLMSVKFLFSLCSSS